jgi:hypothetical protein
MVNVLYDFGNFQYSCGNYGAASELLYQFRVLSTDNEKVSAATWGKLASEILTGNWEAAMEEVQKVTLQQPSSTTHPPNMAHSLVSISILQLRTRTRYYLRTLLLRSLH